MKDFELSDLCHIEPAKDGLIIYNNHTYDQPVRIGKIIDDIIKTTQQKKNEIETLLFKNAKLNTHNFTFLRLDGEKVSLTEKETEILSHLHNKKPITVSKTELLKSVWNYADNVETHTLETHIYRLRQKIELDPAKPQILLTKEEGYTVI